MSSHRRLLAVAVALGAVILLTSPTLAAKWDFTGSQSGVSGSAQSEFVCIDNGDGTETCSSSAIFVFVGRSKSTGTPMEHVEDVCYGDFSDTFVTDTGEPVEFTSRFGCVDAGDAITVDDLSTISLEPTEIPLTEVVCDLESCSDEVPGGTVVVEGEWTGFGPITKQKSRFHFDDGICISMDSQRGTFRQADFTGTVNSEPFVAEFAEISDSTFTFRSGCVGDEE